MNLFLQTPPRLPDAWRSDAILQEALRFRLGGELFELASPELAELGARSVSREVLDLAARAELEPPRHIPYSSWGERIDEIEVSDAYVALGRMGVAAGVTALPYEETPFGPLARVFWGGVLSLWGPSSAIYWCPVAMTDAAARTLLEFGGIDDLRVVERLTSRDPDTAWTSGQWMTETTGGSDVGRTGTVARRDDQGSWRLTGTKWFTSATTSEVALTLARPEGAPEGSRGLALFRVARINADGERNRIVVRRLKEKLGTRALPTAELELDGALAFPVGDPFDGGGVRRISTMLNITRIHNSLSAAASIGRGLAWARAYAHVREAFGTPLERLPAHQATLFDMATDYAAALELSMRCAELCGRMEHGALGPDEAALLRGLTPVTKAATARWAVAAVAEAMESVGGVGYCEDSTIPALVRNTHVLPIWEGTTNVLSLDLLRADARTGALSLLLEDARTRASQVATHDAVAPAAEAVLQAVADLQARAARVADPGDAQRNARALTLGLAATYACAGLCLQGAAAADEGRPATAAYARRLAARGLVPAAPPPADDLELDARSVAGLH